MPLNQQQYSAIAQALKNAKDTAPVGGYYAWHTAMCNNIADILQADEHARFNRRKFLEDAGA